MELFYIIILVGIHLCAFVSAHKSVYHRVKIL